MITPEECGLPQRVLDAILETLARHPRIEQAILYGSRALGTFRPSSDIDLTIKGPLDYRELLVLENELDELMLPYKINLSLFHQIDNDRLVQHIERVGRVMYFGKATAQVCRNSCGNQP